MIWRIVTSDKIPDGLIALQTQWTVADLVDAHEVLDIIEVLEKDAADRAKQKAGRNK